jgi:hypothetical protein
MTATSGSIPVTPALLVTTASLKELRAAIQERRYDSDPFGAGWGSVRDSDDLVGRPGRLRPQAGSPEIAGQTEEYPEQLRARYYWNEAETLRNGSGEDSELTRLRAVDVVISSTPGDGQLLALISERDDKRLASVEGALRDVIESVDDAALLSRDDTSLKTGDSDFFRWLLYRSQNAPDLDLDYSLTAIRAIRSEDSRWRTANIGKGADLDRMEMLALIANGFTTFGPAKVLVWSAPLELGVSMELAGDGAFTIYRGQTEYALGIDEAPLPEPDYSLKLLQDVAYIVLPDLRQLYLKDSAWTDSTRASFRKASIQTLIASLRSELLSI